MSSIFEKATKSDTLRVIHALCWTALAVSALMAVSKIYSDKRRWDIVSRMHEVKPQGKQPTVTDDDE